MLSERWKQISPSQFAWESEALEFLKEALPDRDPYRVWANFEFIADDGSINEVDALVFTPMGLFLVEIKSRPGELGGNAYTWTWRTDGRLFTDDNPLIAANRKARKLASLLKREKGFAKVKPPFLEAVIFCSAQQLQVRLDGAAGRNILTRRDVVDALVSRVGLSSDQQPAGRHGEPTARALVQSMASLGIKPTQRSRRVGDHQLEKLIHESATGLYQDWVASHVALAQTRRVVRIYTIAAHTPPEERAQAGRFCEREFRVLQGLVHPGIALAESFTLSELGPALVFRLPVEAQRLDHYLAQKGGQLSVDVRLSFTQQLADALKYAHTHHVVHRALSPQSVYVLDPEAPIPHLQVFNWQLHRRGPHTGTAGSTHLTATLHAEQWVEDSSLVYLAPEAHHGLADEDPAQDVFALGAVTWFLFTGTPPASSPIELLQRVQAAGGLDLATVMDAPSDALRKLVQDSTSADRLGRPESMADFLHRLAEVEIELMTPDLEARQNPLTAVAGDRLLGGFEVVERLGKGSTALALLVRHDGQESVLKIAHQPPHNDRLRAEFQALQKLSHPGIVRVHREVEIPPLAGFLMERAGEETLAARLRADGRLHFDLLERFGADLLEAVVELEKAGVAHRDIKPENIGVRKRGKLSELHLVLFDFSLTATPAENLRCGTPQYLDPFLVERRPARWDLSAERFAVGLTLYEMATGTLPQWGDGLSLPSTLPDEVSLFPERFDPSLREPLSAFFAQALRRDPRRRFDHAGDMLAAWRAAFADADLPATGGEVADEQDRAALVAAATLTTQLVELGLKARSANALDRLNTVTVRDFLRVSLWRLNRLPGVGKKTIRELSQLHGQLRARFPEVAPGTEAGDVDDPSASGPELPSVDFVVQQLRQSGGKTTGAIERAYVQTLLGLPTEAVPVPLHWPGQTEVARLCGVSRQRIGQAIIGARTRWAKFSAVTGLRDALFSLLEAEGGALTVDEAAEALLAARGSSLAGPPRDQAGLAVTRAAVETEGETDEARFIEARSGAQVLIARSPELADYVFRLGVKADELAALDPLAPPARVLETLRSIALPAGASPLADARLVRLAVRVSRSASLSSRLEIYPRGMDAARAVRLAAGALLGTRDLTQEEVQQRVASRYPEAAPVPPRPELAILLEAAGTKLSWDDSARDGLGAFRQERTERITLASGSSLSSAPPPPRPSVEVPEAALFEERLRAARQEQASLLLVSELADYPRVQRRLTAEFHATVVDVDARLLAALRAACAARGNVQWDRVLAADEGGPGSPHWDRLQVLVSAALESVRDSILREQGLVVLVHLGLLARYGHLNFLTQLLDRPPSERGQVEALWALVPSHRQNLLPTLHGQAVPVPTRGQWSRVPEGWAAAALAA